MSGSYRLCIAAACNIIAMHASVPHLLTPIIINTHTHTYVYIHMCVIISRKELTSGKTDFTKGLKLASWVMHWRTKGVEVLEDNHCSDPTL